MKKFKRILAMGILILFCGMMTGCTREGTMRTKEKDNPEETNTVQAQVTSQAGFREEAVSKILYQAKVSKISSADYQEQIAYFYDGKLYYEGIDEKKENYVIRMLNLETGEEADFLPLLEGNLVCFCMTQEGEIRAILDEYHFEEDNGESINSWHEYFLATFDGDGKEKTKVPLAEEAFFKDHVINCMEADGEGNVYIAGTGLLILTPEGDRVNEIEFEEGTYPQSLARTGEGEVFICYSTMQGEGMIANVRAQQGVLEVLEGVPGRIGGIATLDFSGDGFGELLAYRSDRLYRMDVKKKVLIPLLDWADVGVQGFGVTKVCLWKDRIYALEGVGKTLVSLSEQEEDEAGIKELTIATIAKDSLLEEAVATFNRSQSEYKLKINNYTPMGNDSLAYQEAYSKIMMDVLGDNPPDLIDISKTVSMNLSPSVADLLDKEYVVDLTPYFGPNTHLRLEDFDERALQFGRSEGKLAAVPYQYVLCTLLANADELGDRNGWSVSDMIAYDRDHPGEPMIENYTRGWAVNFCLLRNLDYFVDFEKGICRFDCPQFREAMEYAATIPDGDGTYYIDSEEKLVKIEYMYGLYDYRKASRMRYGGKACFIGFPSMDGKSVTEMKVFDDMIAICNRSENKDGAWMFLESFLDTDPNKNGSTLYYGFPVRRQFLQEGFVQLSELHHEVSGLDEETKILAAPFTATEMEQFEQILNNIKIEDPRMENIKVIFREEIEPYFARQKNLDQVIDILENRVQLYLDEMR